MPKDKDMILAKLFRDYIKPLRMTEAEVPPEIKDAFYGGANHLLDHFISQVATIPEDDGVAVMEQLDQELREYFISRINQN